MTDMSSSTRVDQENELISESFLIRIWLEDPSENGRTVPWHGQITHVSSGKFQYIKDISDVVRFLSDYLDHVGARINWNWRLKKVFSRKTSLKPNLNRDD